MEEIPITGLEELESHLQQLVDAPDTLLNANLFDEVELQLTGKFGLSIVQFHLCQMAARGKRFRVAESSCLLSKEYQLSFESVKLRRRELTTKFCRSGTSVSFLSWAPQLLPRSWQVVEKCPLTCTRYQHTSPYSTTSPSGHPDTTQIRPRSCRSYQSLREAPTTGHFHSSPDLSIRRCSHTSASFARPFCEYTCHDSH